MVLLLTSAFFATAVALHAHWRVIRHILCPLVYVLARIYNFCMPVLVKLMRQSVITVLSQPRHVAVAQILTFIALLGLFLIAHRLRPLLKPFMLSFRNAVKSLSSQYDTLRLQVKENSKAVAAVLPHALYAIGVSAIHFLIMRKDSDTRNELGVRSNSFLLSHRIANIVCLVLAAVICPVIKSVRVLYSMNARQNMKGIDDARAKSQSGGNSFLINTMTTTWPVGILSKILNSLLSRKPVSIKTSAWKQQKEHRGNGHLKFGLLSGITTDITCTDDTQPQTKLFNALSNGVLSILPSMLSIGKSLLTLVPVRLFKNKTITTENADNNDDSDGVEKCTMSELTSHRHVLFRLWHGHREICTRSSTANHDENLGLLRRWTVRAGVPKDSDITTAGSSRKEAIQSGNEQDAASPSALKPLTSPLDENGKSNEVSRASHERELLRFWIFMAIMWIIRCSLHVLCPSLSMFRRMLYAGDVWLLYVVVWALLGLTKGADIMCAVLVRLLHRNGLVLLPFHALPSSYSRKWQGFESVSFWDSARSSSTRKMKKNEVFEQLGILMRVAKSLSITQTINVHRVWRFLFDSGLALFLFLVFTLTPRPITYLAAIGAGVIWPCIRSVLAIEAKDVDGDKDEDKKRSPSTSIGDCDDGHVHCGRLRQSSSAALRRQNWLAYWTVNAVLELAYAVVGARLSWVPLWLHVKVAIVVWLQADDSAGAFYLLDWTMARIGFEVSSFNR